VDKSAIVILIIVALCVIGSFPAVRISRKKQKIYSGTPGKIFHHIAVAAYIGVAPAALLGTLVVGVGFGVPLALTGVTLTFVMLLLYALEERSARIGIDVDEHTWTQEDAKSSGL
jgi:Flp pilus assembly protein TadB